MLWLWSFTIGHHQPRIHCVSTVVQWEKDAEKLAHLVGDTLYSTSVLLRQCPLAWHDQFAQLCNDSTLLGFGQAACLMFHLFLIVNLQ